jgi:hypothetical protein
VGFLGDLRAFLGRTPSLLTAAAVAASPQPGTSKPQTQAEGITGGANFFGRIIGFEDNEALTDQAGYGRAGTYDPGAWQNLAKANPYVAAGLDFICSPVADARVGVEPAKSGIDEASAKRHAEFIEWAFTIHFRLGAHIEAAARQFLLSGFALFEPTFAQVPYSRPAADQVADDVAREKGAKPLNTGGTVWALSSLAERLPNSLDMAAGAWLETPDGRLRAIRQSGPVGMGSAWVRTELEAERVLLYSWKRQGNNFAGESQLRSCWYAASRIFTMLVKMTGVTLQREGPGLPVITPLTGNDAIELTPDQREELAQLVGNLSFHEAAGVVMPPGFKFEWVHSSGANKGHLIEVMKSIGLWVLMQLSAQQLYLGTDSTGSRSVGEVHDARAMAFVRKVLAFIEGVINGDLGEPQTGLVKRLIDFNFGPQPAYPRVKLTPQRPELSPMDQATAAKSAKDAGLFTPMADDENAWRERAGFQPITEEERDAAKEKARALAPQIPAPGQAPGGDDTDDPKAKQLQASAQRQPWMPWRSLRASEQRVPWAKRAAYFDAQRDVFEKAVRPVVVAMLAKAGPAIAGAMSDGKVLPEEIATIPLDVARLSQVVRAYCAAVRKAGNESVREEMPPTVLRAAAEEEQGDEREDEVAQARQDADELEAAESNRLTRRIVGRTRGELEREAVDALRTGETAQSVLERAVMRQVDSGAFRADAGYVTTKLFNGGRDEATRVMGCIAEVEYSALLDSSTCTACRADDGRTADFNSAEHDALVPPNRDCSGGDNCRCLLVMIPERGDA